MLRDIFTYTAISPDVIFRFLRRLRHVIFRFCRADMPLMPLLRHA